MKIGYYVRFECGSEDRMSQDFGPFEDYFQITYGELTAGPEGDISIADFHDGNWYLAKEFGDHAKPWSDVVIYAKDLQPTDKYVSRNITNASGHSKNGPDNETDSTIVSTITQAVIDTAATKIEDHLREVGSSGIVGITKLVFNERHDLKSSYEITQKALDDLIINGKVLKEDCVYHYVT